MHMSEVSGDSENAMVSIIVPVYNVEPYLRQCLDSLLSQSYRNLQIVCVNDGSTDGSPAILEEYAARDSRVCVIHQPNGGLSAARNKALTVCKGKWLMFCDSDDYLADSRAVAKMCGYVEACGGNIGLCGFCKYDDGSGKSAPMLPLPGIAESGCYTITPDLVSHVVTRCYMFNKMFRKELIDRLQLQFDVGRIYEDVAFSLIAFLACMGEPIAVCNEKLYHYRQREGSILATMRKKDPRAMDALFGVNPVSPTEISAMIRKADLFITDYSSVCFDFMYMDVPTIFYRFDADVTHPDERDNQDADDAAQEDSRLYNVFYDEQAAMDKIDFYVRNGCQLESELRARNEQIFWTRENNCKNLIELLNEDAYV